MNVNYLAVLVAAIAHMVVGMVWFSPALFANAWLASIGKTEKDMKKMQHGIGKAYAISFVTAFVSSAVLGYTLAYFEVTSMWLAIQLAFWLWLGFSAAPSLSGYLFEHKSFTHYSITQGYTLTCLIIAGLILTVWA